MNPATITRYDLTRPVPRTGQLLGEGPFAQAVVEARRLALSEPALRRSGITLDVRVYDTWASLLVCDRPHRGVCPGLVSYVVEMVAGDDQASAEEPCEKPHRRCP